MSIAAQLLKSLNEDENPLAKKDEPAPADAPAAKGDETPADGSGEKNPLKEMIDLMKDPHTMSEALDLMSDQCDKYMDEEDQDTYTAKDDQEKKELTEARSKIREAASMYRGKKY